MRNAIVFAALLMVLFNPKILRFDIGFQLSFAALIGIVYLAPSIQKFLRLKKMADFWAGGKIFKHRIRSIGRSSATFNKFRQFFIIFSSGKYFDFRSDSLNDVIRIFNGCYRIFLIHPIFNFRMVYGNYSDLRTYNH